MAIIRPYEPRDRAALRDLVLALHEAVRPFDPDLPPGAAIVDAHVERLLQDVERTRGLIAVAEDAGVVLGYVCLLGLVDAGESDERPEPYSYLAELYVDPRLRGGGVGEALLTCAEDHARRSGAWRIELKVQNANTGAQKLYARRGYRARHVVMTRRLD